MVHDGRRLRLARLGAGIRLTGDEVVRAAGDHQRATDRVVDELPPDRAASVVGTVLLEGGDHRSPGFEGSGCSRAAGPALGAGAVRATYVWISNRASSACCRGALILRGSTDEGVSVTLIGATMRCSVPTFVRKSPIS